MIDLDEYIDSVREKISVIPNFDRESVESLLEALPNLGEFEARQIIQDIDSIVEPAYQRHKLRSKNAVLSFPSKDESKGDLLIGSTCAGDQVLYPFSLTTENLRENVFSTARAGHGKTTLVFYVVHQLVLHKIKFFMPDWKNDYAVLAQKYPDVSSMGVFDCRYNPLTNAPEGMELKDWHRVVFTIFCHSFGLLSATESYLPESMDLFLFNIS